MLVNSPQNTLTLRGEVLLLGLLGRNKANLSGIEGPTTKGRLKLVPPPPRAHCPPPQLRSHLLFSVAGGSGRISTPGGLGQRVLCRDKCSETCPAPAHGAWLGRYGKRGSVRGGGAHGETPDPSFPSCLQQPRPAASERPFYRHNQSHGATG